MQPLVYLERWGPGIHLNLMPELNLVNIALGYVLLVLGEPRIETFPIDRVMGFVWVVRPGAFLGFRRLPRQCDGLKQLQHLCQRRESMPGPVILDCHILNLCT